MKFGMIGIGCAAGITPSGIRTLATTAERLGFSTIYAVEHVVFTDDYERKYPYSKAGELPGSTRMSLFDPFIALTYAAAVTTRIRLGTGISLIPMHNPVILAKEIASLDQLAEGRFMLGAGIGWMEEEFSAAGIPFEERGKRTEEYIDAMKRLWGDDPASYSGQFVKFEKIRCNPKPIKGAALPITFGGETTAAMRRVARQGTGWFGYMNSPEQAEEKIKKLHKILAEHGRKPQEVEIIITPNDPKYCDRDSLKRYRDAGANEIVMQGWWRPCSDEDNRKNVEQLARTWLDPIMALG
ncbi:MAG TPA: LLM class F420-dependent oxidoreductase [Candidatus Binataceae bacterium]|jgi:probable F420-dependent oxidoreductase|nr:LLM class F420-dependent oxidoreductase [Candidatus Binataceae bacterium]